MLKPLRTVPVFLVLALAAPALGQDEWLAIEGGTVFDGTGAVHENAVLLIRGDRIQTLGRVGEVEIPAGANRLDASGKFLLPGFIDLHYHYRPGIDPWMPLILLANGVTTLREMGVWIEDNEAWLDSTRAAGHPTPRFLYSGPLLDGTNPAHPEISLELLDELDARHAVNRLVDQGASSLKVYFRLPPTLIRAVIEEADRRGIPVHGHLEIVDARDAIRLGLDGIEHTTSVGPALVPEKEAEAYRQAVLRDSWARADGRFQMWAEIDPEGERATALIELMLEHGVNLDATLATFEPERGEEGTEERALAVQNMAAFTVRYHRAGGSVTIGSHGHVPNALAGFAYQRELEMHVEAGMAPADVLQAATRAGAAALRLDDRGTLAPGKLADVLILDADPLEDISNVGRVHAVILGGEILDRAALLAARPGWTGEAPPDR